jgi:PAS domain S-box-containing protein
MAASPWDEPGLADALLAAVHQPVLILDPQLRVVGVSPSVAPAFMLDPAEILGRDLFSLGGGVFRIPELRRLIEEEVPTGDMVEGHFEHPTRSGARLVAHARPLRGADGRILRIVLALESQRTDAELGASDPEWLHRLLSESMADVLALHAEDGRFLYVSPSVETVLGRRPGDILGADPRSLAHPEDRDRLTAFFAAAAGAERQARTVVRILRADGEEVWMEVAARAVQDRDGRRMVHTVSRDVTRRKRTEEALEWLSRQTRLILDSAADGILGVDVSGRITFANPAAARIAGLEVGELVGRPVTDLIGSGEEGGLGLEPVYRDGLPLGPVPGEVRRPGGDGETGSIAVEYTGTPATDGTQMRGAVVTFRDIRQRLESEETLLRSEWLSGIGETALALKHEINNPLTSMIADASLLEMGGNTPEEEEEMILSIVKQARRIRDVVRRLWEQKDSPRVRYLGSQRMLDLSTPSDPVD